MKKGLYIAALALIPVLFSACQEEKDPFGGMLPSERMEAALNKLDSTLLSAPYGWEMQYFAKPNTAGYPLLVKFSNNSEVLVAGQNRNTSRAYQEAVSYYDIREGNGAMLTFETYNEVLHAFVNPENPAGKGQEGDYEFYVDTEGYSFGADTLVLLGKKRGTKILMVKLTQEWENWANYFTTLSKVNELTFANNIGTEYAIRVNGAGPMVKYNEYIFTSDEHSYGFVLTPTGMRLYNGVQRDEQIAYNFVLDDLNNPTKFVCTDEGIEATIEARYTPIYVFQSSSSEARTIWSINTKEFGATLNNLFAQLKSNVIATGAALAEIDLVYVTETNQPAIRFRYRVSGREYEARIFFKYTFTPRTKPTAVTFEYANVSEDGASFLKRAGNGDEQAGLSLIKSMFEYKYGVTCSVGGTFNPSVLLFTAQEDAGITFTVKKKSY